MISRKPKIVKYGFGLGILGGLIAIVASIGVLDLDVSSSITYVSLNLLVAVLFFGVGGAFASGGPGSWSTVTVMAAFTTGVVVAVTLYGSMSLWFGIVLAVIGIFIILVAADPKVGRWIKTDRLAN